MQTAVDPVTHAASAQRTGWVLAMVIGTTVLTGLSMSIMVVTFPAIRADFPDATPAQLSWINNLFTIVSAATLIPCGVLADRVGRKRMLLVGAALFTTGSVIGALAPSPEWIMVGRTVQALGAASFGPAGTALLISSFPPARLPTAIGIWAVTSGVASAAGPSVGGIVVDWGGWQWAFWLSVPIGLFAVVFGPFVLRESERDRSRRLPDLLGMVLVMAATSVITLGVVLPLTGRFAKFGCASPPAAWCWPGSSFGVSGARTRCYDSTCSVQTTCASVRSGCWQAGSRSTRSTGRSSSTP